MAGAARPVDERRRRRGAGLVTAVLAFAALLGGCRDGPDAFEPVDRPPVDANPQRLTYSAGTDRSPVWAAGGDSVYYAAEGFDHLLPAPNLLVGMPRTGGVARPILENLRSGPAGAARRFFAPAVAPAGDRVAFGHLVRPVFSFCSGSPDEPPGSTALPGAIDRLAIRVRGLDETGPLSGSPAWMLDLAGVEFDASTQPFSLPGVFDAHIYPFHRAYLEDGTAFFRPSWAPDGRRVAFSDGLRLLIWDTDAGTVVPVAGTADGWSPAWSPNGEWIAFTHRERRDSTTTVFAYRSITGTPVCAERRTEYVLGPALITLVRPDGSERIELTRGAEAAWAPDGETLYYRRDGRIWRVDVNGTNAEAVDAVGAGREPALSPNGRFLAFSKHSESYDIWVVELP